MSFCCRESKRTACGAFLLPPSLRRHGRGNIPRCAARTQSLSQEPCPWAGAWPGASFICYSSFGYCGRGQPRSALLYKMIHHMQCKFSFSTFEQDVMPLGIQTPCVEHAISPTFAYLLFKQTELWGLSGIRWHQAQAYSQVYLVAHLLHSREFKGSPLIFLLVTSLPSPALFQLVNVNKNAILTCSGLVPGLHLTTGLTFPGSSLWHENLNLIWTPFAPDFTFSFPLRKKGEN